MITETAQNIEAPDDALLTAHIIERYEAAKKRRNLGHNLWEECYDFALPQRGGFLGHQNPGQPRTNRIYDATAMDAADQLAASLMGNLTPSWSQWFGLIPS